MLPVGGKGLTRISHENQHFVSKRNRGRSFEPWLLMISLEKIEIAALVGLQHAVLK